MWPDPVDVKTVKAPPTVDETCKVEPDGFLAYLFCCNVPARGAGMVPVVPSMIFWLSGNPWATGVVPVAASYVVRVFVDGSTVKR